jgi:hypothetical protein
MIRSNVIFVFVLVAIAMIFLVVSGCKKEPGPGGKNTITGSVVFKNGDTGNNDAAPFAAVSIAYGVKEVTGNFDQTILADAEGKFTIEGLHKGDYYITASYTDSHGFRYVSAGYGITFESRKKTLEVNIELQ